MLINASRLIGTKVLSLQLGGAVAQVVDLIINPDNLQIIAFQLEGPVIGGETGDILDARSIREFSQLGFIIDDTDELVFRTDVVRIDQIMSLDFHLVGLKVVTQKGASLGKISDFVVDPSTLLTQQLVVQRPFFKSLMDPELIIHRSQIVEVDDYKVTVKEDTEKVAAKSTPSEAFVPNFVNPFRKSDQPAEATESSTSQPSKAAENTASQPTEATEGSTSQPSQTTE